MINMRITAFITALATSCLASAGSVLVLDDDFGNEVVSHLESEGHVVTSLSYREWEGNNPAPAAFDLVVLLDGYHHDFELGDEVNSPAYAALESYVTSGGTFLMTEWVAYDMGMGNGGIPKKLALEPLVPFEVDEYVSFDYSGTYKVVENSVLTSGLPASFSLPTDAYGGSCVPLKAGTKTLMTRQFDYYDPPECPGDNAALVTMGVGAGTVIWFNSDLGHYDDQPATANHLKVIANAVSYSLISDVPSVPVPTLPVGGLLALLTIFGGFGAYRLSDRRNRQVHQERAGSPKRL